MNKITVLLCLLLLVFSACKKDLYTFDDNASNEINVVETDFEYLTAKIKIDFQDGRKDLKASADLRIKKDSIIWFSVTPGLGIEASRGILTKDSLVIINKIDKVYSVLDFEELSERFKFEIDFHLVQSAILGNLIFPYENTRVSRLPDYFNYKQTKGKFLFDNFIGTSSNKIEKLLVKDLETQNTLQVIYKNFQEIDGQILPYQVFSSFNYFKASSATNKKTIVNIVYNKASIEKKPLRFPFRIPQKYEKK